MIHDILLSLMTPNLASFSIETFLVSDATAQFIHPGEKKILEEIIQIIKKFQEISKFTKEYGANLNFSDVYDAEEPLQKGLYLQAFAAGIDKVLDNYFEEMSEIEKSYLRNPSQSLLFIYHKVNVFHPLFHFLQRLIRGIKSQRMHGCIIMQYIHQNMLHGNKQIVQAMKIIQSTVKIVFLKQITHWILYGKIVDNYGEFFIQSSEGKNSIIDSERCTSASSGRLTNTTSDVASTYADIWRYEIYYDFLPHYLSSSWAEKVFFVGQTVLMFTVDSHKTKKHVHLWNECTEKTITNGSLWNDKEHVFFQKIQNLQQQDDLNISQYEMVVDEIKAYVTERLSQIAVDQADLIKQLKLIKDFYLLGRGELYLEFIKRTYSIGKSVVTETIVRDIIKAFELSAHSVNVSEDLEQFSLTIPKDRVDLEDFGNYGYLQHLNLMYKINWPLHLLFSPKVIERYNELFRFLLLVKKMQYELHMMWCDYRKHREQGDMNILKLRNQLMFLLDNLQYYIQVDVLESQFSILMNTVINSSDFEHIQRAHSIFQANVLSLCFLLTNENNTKSSVIQSENPVYSILSKIFHLSENFCTLTRSLHNPMTTSELEEASLLQKQLAKFIDQLMNLLVGLKVAPSCTPLSQLLLRLNFNYWFSNNKETVHDE